MKISRLRRKFRFNADHAGIMTRFINEEKNWFEHLNNTKSFILKSAKGKDGGICLIIGSGWCLDVPFEELSKKFSKVILADIIHPRQIEHKIKRFTNIELLTIDVSGFLESLFNYKRDKNINKNLYDFLKEQTENSFIEKIKPDFVVSVNILSQLAYFPVEYIKRHKLASEIDLSLIRKMIEKKHLDILPKGKSVLTTDYYELEYNFEGKLMIEQDRLSVVLPKEKIVKEWIWDFDLSGNYYTRNCVKFKVAALQV